MITNRRDFLKTLGWVATAAGAPRLWAATGPFPAAPNLHRSPLVSAMVSGGTITKDGKLLPAVSAAHRLHYGARKKILLILHASVPADWDSVEQRMRPLFEADGYAVELATLTTYAQALAQVRRDHAALRETLALDGDALKRSLAALSATRKDLDAARVALANL